jgi:hypothetical protein
MRTPIVSQHRNFPAPDRFIASGAGQFGGHR